MDSPFSRSSRTARSPPPGSSHSQDENTPAPTAPQFSVVSTPEIQKWISQIDGLLTEVCSISTDGGKLNSESKIRISNICRSVMHGVSQMAVQYQSVKQKFISAHAEIENLEKDNDTCLQLRELKNGIQNAAKVTPPQSSVSYADIIRTGKEILVCPPKTASLTIYPADKEKSSEETKKMVQRIIQPEKLKLHIRGLRKIGNGGVIISTAGKEDLEKLKTSQQLQLSGLKIEETSKKKPRLIFLGVPSDTSEQHLFDRLFEQNITDKRPSLTREEFLNSIRLSHKSGKKDSPYSNYIVEVTAEIRSIIIKQERIFIDWTSCPVRDFTLVTRCYKCHQYGHSAKYCRDTAPTCGHCGCPGHTLKECSARDQSPKCASCMRFNKPHNHGTGDVQCPTRKNAEARLLQSTDYEGA